MIDILTKYVIFLVSFSLLLDELHAEKIFMSQEEFEKGNEELSKK